VPRGCGKISGRRGGDNQNQRPAQRLEQGEKGHGEGKRKNMKGNKSAGEETGGWEKKKRRDQNYDRGKKKTHLGKKKLCKRGRAPA